MKNNILGLYMYSSNKLIVVLTVLLALCIGQVVFRRKLNEFFEKQKTIIIIIYLLLFLSIFGLRFYESTNAMIDKNWNRFKTELFPSDLCPFIMLSGPLIMMNKKYRNYLALSLGVWSILASSISLGKFSADVFAEKNLWSGTLVSFKKWFFNTTWFMHWSEFIMGITFLVIANPIENKKELFRPIIFIASFLFFSFVGVHSFGITSNTTMIRDADLTDPNGEYRILYEMFNKNVHLARFLFYITSVAVVYLIIAIWYWIKKWDEKYINEINPRGILRLSTLTEDALKENANYFFNKIKRKTKNTIFKIKYLFKK